MWLWITSGNLSNWTPLFLNLPIYLTLQPLFRGSKYSAKDLARFLLSFKAQHLKVGDDIFANIVAMTATFLPPDNLFNSRLPQTTSTYSFLKIWENLAAYDTNLRCLQIDVCVKKCMGYYSTYEGYIKSCPIINITDEVSTCILIFKCL